MAEPTAQQLARKRIANVDISAFAVKPNNDKRLRENSANVRKASRKYSATPKGKLTNSQKCMIYQRNHPEKIKGYVMRYQAKWKAVHGGINMCAWNYWRRRLDRGEIAPEEVPAKYEICLNEWRSKKMKYHELKPITITDECGSYRVYNKSDVDAAIDELKSAHHKERHEYIKMIAELKKKLMPCLNGDCILTCEVVEKYGKENAELKQKLEDAQASAYADSVDAGMRERRLKRALWLAREQTAIEKHNHFALCHNHSTDLYLCINGASIPTESSTTMRLSSEWSMIWKRVVAKCRAKAEEYK